MTGDDARAADYCAARARWWRGEIPAMPATPGAIVAVAQAAYGLECEARATPSDKADECSSDRIAALWVKAEARIRSSRRGC